MPDLARQVSRRVDVTSVAKLKPEMAIRSHPDYSDTERKAVRNVTVGKA